MIEDDYDGEFRYSGRPLLPLAALDAGQERVIYVGTFSKVLARVCAWATSCCPEGSSAPSPRLVPWRIDSLRGRIRLSLPSSSRGYLARYIRAMRALYRARRDALADAVACHADGLLDMALPECGLHALGLFSDSSLMDTEIYGRALRLGLQTPPLSAYYSPGHPRSGLLLGFASTPEEQIAPAVRRLVTLFHRC
uniref:Aminotransferase class I/classII domain-containing protein n=1 Tax=Bosea sp. NBC_00436 TaxID=2969620 RepID=A0A9E8CRP9_9HYPH